MIDITMKYDWNNHKVMDKELLLSSYLKLNDNDRTKVYEFLSDSRKILLNKSLIKYYEKEIQVEKSRQLENEKIKLLDPYKENIDLELIRNVTELKIMYTLLYAKDKVLEDLFERPNKDPNLNVFEESFNTTKEKFIKLLIEMDNLEAAVYVSALESYRPTTLTESFDAYRKAWDSIFSDIGVKKTRRDKITGKLLLVYKKDFENKTSSDDRPYIVNGEVDMEKMDFYAKFHDSYRKIYKETIAPVYIKFGLKVLIPWP